MGGKRKEAPRPIDLPKLDPELLQAYIAILREIRAPESSIAIAERVAAEEAAATK